MDAELLCFIERFINGMINNSLIHREFFGDGIGDQHSALDAEIELRFDRSSDFPGCIKPIIHLKTAFTGVECGHILRTVTNHGDALCFKIFKSKPDIEYALGACAYDRNGSPRQLLKVRRNIHRLRRTSVNTADTAGSEYADTCHIGKYHRTCNGQRTVSAACREHGNIPAACLCYGHTGFSEILQLLISKAGTELSSEYGACRRYCAVLACDARAFACCGDVFGIGHTV